MCWARPAAGTFAQVQLMTPAPAQPGAVSRCLPVPLCRRGGESQSSQGHLAEPLGSTGMWSGGAENRAKLKGLEGEDNSSNHFEDLASERAQWLGYNFLQC